VSALCAKKFADTYRAHGADCTHAPDAQPSRATFLDDIEPRPFWATHEKVAPEYAALAQ
jgi:hypothetical protein